MRLSRHSLYCSIVQTLLHNPQMGMQRKTSFMFKASCYITAGGHGRSITITVMSSQ